MMVHGTCEVFVYIACLLLEATGSPVCKRVVSPGFLRLKQ